MDELPSAYTGSDAYLFVAYSHHDRATVYPEIRWLQGQGMNVTFDEGVSPGSEWSDAIARQIQGCDHFIYFVTPASASSEHCRRELNFALEENRRVLAVHLEPTEVPAGIRLSLNNRQAIFKHMLDDDAYRRKLGGSLMRDDAPARAVPEPQRSTTRRLHLAVASGVYADESVSRDLRSAIARYLSWQGGIYRAHDAGTGRAPADRQADYRIEVSVRLQRPEAEISWQVSREESGEIVWANRTTEPNKTFRARSDRVAEMIGEGAVQIIAEHELHRVAGQTLAELGYTHLLLKAGQLNYLVRHEVEERRQALEQAMGLEPHAGLPHASLAELIAWQIINGMSGDPEQALQTLQREARTALRLEGNDPAVLLSVGITYCRIGRHGPGLSLIRRAHRLAPTVAAKDQLARSLCFAGRPEEAIALFEEILDTMPQGLSFPYVRLAVAQAQAGRLEAALRNSVESVLNFPEDYYGWFVHANLLAQLDREVEAREALREGQRLAPGLTIETVIDRTAATYGSSEAQRRWLTAGLKRLLGNSG